MQPLLEWIARSQGSWSATAGRLKQVHERARWLSFACAALGALAAAVASQLPDDTPRRALAIAGAVLLGLGGLLNARFLGPEKAARWVRARSASEALKRAAFLFAAQAAPYDDPATREALLRAEVLKIEQDVDDLLDVQVSTQAGSTPATPLDADGYVAERAGRAAAWYETKAQRHLGVVRALRATELLLVLATTVLTALVGAVSKSWLQDSTGFDAAALVAVLTTLSGLVLAHVEASRYDHLVAGYRSAARRLRAELAVAPQDPVQPSPAWSAFVGRCEDIIASETGSWAARFSKPPGR